VNFQLPFGSGSAAAQADPNIAPQTRQRENQALEQLTASIIEISLREVS
jgi:hypothetical protein